MTALYIVSVLLAAALGVIGYLLKKLRELRSPVPEMPQKHAFTYLAIGNSLTLHGKCSYWWDDRRGMASTTLENDYVHQVAAHLEKQYGKMAFSAFNFAAWEVQAHDRAELLPMLEKHLVPVPDLITVQLSENAKDCTTLKEDFAELLQWLIARAPKAQILVVSDIWSEEKNVAKRAAAEQCRCRFVELGQFINQPEYQCGLGTMVQDDQGGMHRVEHGGVAGHPGDAGMKLIADAIIRNI